jgi:hypothetical protein
MAAELRARRREQEEQRVAGEIAADWRSRKRSLETLNLEEWPKALIGYDEAALELKADEIKAIADRRHRDLIDLSVLVRKTLALSGALDHEGNKRAAGYAGKLGIYMTWFRTQSLTSEASNGWTPIHRLMPHWWTFADETTALAPIPTVLREAMFAYSYLNSIHLLGCRHRRWAFELGQLLGQLMLLFARASEAAESRRLGEFLRPVADGLPDAPERALPRQTRAGPERDDAHEPTAASARRGRASRSLHDTRKQSPSIGLKHSGREGVLR